VSEQGVGPCGKVGEPIDVVGGQMVTAAVDVSLPGVLPLVLRRAYASGYRDRRLFGPGWSSTLDIRIVVAADGISLLDDDGRVLHYPVPDADQDGAVRPVLPDEGERLPLVWDRAADEIRVTDQAAGSTWIFTTLGATREGTAQIRMLTALVDRNGNRVVFVHDGFGAPLEVQHSAGYRVLVEGEARAGGWRVTGLRLAAGSGLDDHGAAAPVEPPEFLCGFEYDARGRLTGVVDEAGQTLHYECDAADRIVAWVDRTGYRFVYEYDDQGRVVRTTGDGDFLSGTLEYDPPKRTTVYTDSLGNRTEYHYDEHGRVRETIDPLGGVVVTEYDAYGRLLSYRDQHGNATTLTLDANGDPTAVVRPDGAVIRAEYNAFRTAQRIVHADGATWQYTYDERGNLVAETDPLGAIRRFGYDDRGRPTETIDPLGNRTLIETDRSGMPVRVTDPLGAVWQVRRDARGRVLSAGDPLGAQTETRWGLIGRAVRQSLPDGSAEAWEWDDEGRLTAHVDPAGQRTRFDVGEFGRIRARIDPDGARYEFAHDSELRLTAVTGPTGLSWTYRYDPAGQLVAERDFNGRELTYAYDAAGQLTSRTNGVGQRIELVRDALGQVVEQRAIAAPDPDGAAHPIPDPSRDPTPAPVTHFGYDPAGRLIRATTPDTELVYTRDLLGRVLTEAVDGWTVSSAYDAAGRRVSRTTPIGRQSAWSYDAANRAASLAAGQQQIAFGYDAAGRESHRWIGAHAAITSEWDALDRMTVRRLLAVDGPPEERRAHVVDERMWEYRRDGVVAALHDTTGGTRRYEADPLGRVTAVRAEDWTESYAYDPMGNLIQSADTRTPDGATAGARSVEGTLLRRAGRTEYEYDGQGRLTRAVRRTLSGKALTWQYSYDVGDRMVSAALPGGEVWRYRYDALGRRIGKQRYAPDGAAGPETRFSWDGAVLAEQYTPGKDDVVTVWDYEPGSWTPVAQERLRITVGADDQRTVDARFHAIVADLLGAPAELIGPNGAVAWRRSADLWGGRAERNGDDSGSGNGNGLAGIAAGAQAEDAVDCPLGFPGQYLDRETGLCYNFLRYYDPDTGRYLTGDPIGLSGSPNPHAYVLNPLSLADPVGLKPKGGKPAVATPDGPEPIRVYDPGGKHGPVARSSSRGVNSKEPADGQAALDRSVQIKPTNARRIGVDDKNGEVVILDRTRVQPAPQAPEGEEQQPDTEIYHGHVRNWDDMTSDPGMADAQNAAKRAGLVDKKGNIKPCGA
jgi:RHS repeat-associated protein